MPEWTVPMKNKMTATVGSEAYKKIHAHKHNSCKHNSVHNQYTEQNVEVYYVRITLTYFENKS
jgi:bacillopeptidase F (M6 metalloprotease family)